MSLPLPGAIVKLAGIRTLVLGATGRKCGTWRCLVRGTSGGRLLVAAVVVELLETAELEPVDVALEVAGLALVAVVRPPVLVSPEPVLVAPEPVLELLEAGEELPQAATSSAASSIAIASRGAIAPA